MSVTRINAALRRRVADRAERRCEYCLIHEDDTFFGCEVDHIISEKHGGATTESNLAFACLSCSRFKGSDIASLDPLTGLLTRLFNPRTDHWGDRFSFSEDRLTIRGASPIGSATARILQLNDPERQLERAALIAIHRYPPPGAI